MLTSAGLLFRCQASQSPLHTIITKNNREEKQPHIFKLNTTKIKDSFSWEGKRKIILLRGRDLLILHKIVHLKKKVQLQIIAPWKRTWKQPIIQIYWLNLKLLVSKISLQDHLQRGLSVMWVPCRQCFEIHSSILDEKPDVRWMLLPTNVGMAA